MQIYVRTLTGSKITLDVEPSETIHNVKQKIQDQLGVPLQEHFFIHMGDRMSENFPDGRTTLRDYDIQRESTIDLMREQVGMISSFSFTDATDPLTAYLLAENQTKENEPSKEELDARAVSLDAARNACYKVKYTGDNLLSKVHKEKLIAFADAYVHVMRARESRIHGYGSYRREDCI